MGPMRMFPIPVPADAPPWLGIVFALMAVSGFAVLVWQTTRFLRRSRDHGSDDRLPPDDPELP